MGTLFCQTPNNGYPFPPKWPLKMGTGLAASAAHPRPNNIWVPPPPPGVSHKHPSKRPNSNVQSNTNWKYEVCAPRVDRGVMVSVHRRSVLTSRCFAQNNLQIINSVMKIRVSKSIVCVSIMNIQWQTSFFFTICSFSSAYFSSNE